MKNYLKRILALSLLLAMSLSFVACSEKETNEIDEELTKSSPVAVENESEDKDGFWFCNEEDTNNPDDNAMVVK